MRGFTEFCLCRIRARSAPVSAHLSICRNFATIREGDRASCPRCSYCRCQAANTRLYAHTATVQQHDCANARRRRMAVPRRIAKAARQGFGRRTRIVQRSLQPGSRKHSPWRRSITAIEAGTMPGTWAIGGMPIPKNLTFAFETGVVAVAGTAPEKPHRNLRGFKNPNGVQYLCAVANSTVSHCCSPKNLTFLCEHRAANVEIRSRKGSPVQESGTVKRRFFPRLAGFPAISTDHHSRKASPMRNLCADRAPEKAHLQRVHPTVKRIPKKLTLCRSR